MPTEAITIVDHGRGPQLSTSRITVHDVYPYLKQKIAKEQIFKIMPVLTGKELAIIEEYVQAHRAEVEEQDRRIRERNEQRNKSLDDTNEERAARQQRLALARQMILQASQGKACDPIAY